jgi:hypothetical protein
VREVGDGESANLKFMSRCLRADTNNTALFAYFALFGQSHLSQRFGLNMRHRPMHPNTLDRTPSLCEASATISDHFRLSLIVLMISNHFILFLTFYHCDLIPISFYSIHTIYPKLSKASRRTFAPCQSFLITFTDIPIISLISMFPSCNLLLYSALHFSDLLLVVQNYSKGVPTISKLYLFIFCI